MSNASPDHLLATAITHHQAGRLDQAASGYARVLEQRPQHFQALHLAGAAALQRGDLPTALALLPRALRVQPKSAPTLMCLGLAYSAAGQPQPAENHLRAALKLDPKNAETWGNLGSVLVINGRLAEATEAYRSAIKVNPRYAQAHAGLGACLLLLSRPREAVESHERALALDPNHLVARFGRGQALLACQRVEDARADFRQVLERNPEHHQARSNWLFTLNYSAEVTAEQLYAEHADYGRRLGASKCSVNFPNGADPERKLKLAFLSPDLRAHSIAHFLEPLLRHLDRSAFEVCLYHDYFKVDAVSERLRGHADLWRNFVGQSDTYVEAQIRADAPDLLIDLSGHGSLNRLPLYRRRLAPVQINYLGYPNTTGLTEMDYRLTDAIADPPGAADRIHSEKLIRFSSTAWAYGPPDDAPEVPPLPCLSQPGITFGSFNLAAKLNDFTLGLWGRILSAVPGSRLVLKSFGMEPEFFRSRLAKLALPLDRVTLLPPCATTREHLAAYGQIDIGLDPYPYAGTTTTCEALWMGRPVLTLTGDRHSSRVGASLLQAIGHPEWIASTPDHYIELAVRIAASRPQLQQHASELRQQMARSPLLDHASQADRFAAALRAAWRNWAQAHQTTPSAA